MTSVITKLTKLTVILTFKVNSRSKTVEKVEDCKYGKTEANLLAFGRMIKQVATGD